MKIISHRGNLNGPSECENNPDYILSTIDKGYDVEVDVHYHNDNFWLGHDKPTYKIKKKFLFNKKIWCHLKNLESLYRVFNDNINYFFHTTEDIAITSKGFLWHNPKSDWKWLTKKSIAVCPEYNNTNILDANIFGICTDFVFNYEK